MLIIKTNQPNSLVVTVSQNSELTNPEYLFSFTHIFSKQNVSFIPVDVSLHKSRYDEFYFVEGTGVGEIHFPYEGLYLYSISEQPMGSGNLNPALAYNVVENGEAQIIVQSAITVDSQFDSFISNDEYNSNIIFAPDEPNPTPNITPSPTSTPLPSPTNTPTPSVTPTFTPTPSTTPPSANTPAGLGAMWWLDFTKTANQSFYNPGGNTFLTGSTDLISSVYFTGDTNQAPLYFNTTVPNGGTSGSTFNNALPLSNSAGTYTGGITDFTWFAYMNYDGTQQGAKIMRAYDNGGLSGGWFSFTNPNTPTPNNFRTTYTTSDNSQNVADETLIPSSTIWYAVAIRVYDSGANKTKIECYLDSVMVDNLQVNATPQIVNDAIFGMMYDGGKCFNTEQFFFDKKLSNSEMTQMFNYLFAKYN